MTVGPVAPIPVAPSELPFWQGAPGALPTPEIYELQRIVALTLRPPPRQTVSEWADKERRLSSESSSEHGQWRTSRAEYQRGMMDATSDPGIWKVVFMTSAQVGKTEIINNVVGFHIDQDPGPILVVQPTVGFAETWSKDRLAPMIRDTPCLRGKVADPKSRDTGNTITKKSFPGGSISVVGANSPTDLAGRPVRFVLQDERDRFPRSAGSEGDPGKLSEKRTNNFWNRKVIVTSTPTVKGFSPIEDEYNASDKRKYHIACPHEDCRELHTLQWGNVIYENNDPKTARFRCPHCNKDYTTAQKNRAVAKGRWIATAPFNGIAGFHLNELYSPWRTLAQIVEEWIGAKDNPEKLQVFINTVLGETWEDGGFALDEHELAKRCEPFPSNGELPDRVLYLTGGVDVQPDRLELETVGWAGGEESWSVQYKVFEGDPDIKEGQPKSPWNDLTAYLRKPFEHPIYGPMVIEYTCIDTGGANTQAVYDYVKRHRGERIIGIKGQGGEGIPIISSPKKRKTGKVKTPIRLHMVGTDQAKAIIYRRLRIKDPGAGYCHFPAGRSADYFRQLTAEKIVTKYTKGGFPVRTFEKKSGQRNEALDCRVYAFAALTLAGVEWDKLAFKLKQRAKPMPKRPKPTEPEPTPEAAPGEPENETAAPDPAPTAPEQEEPGEVLIIDGEPTDVIFISSDDDPKPAKKKGEKATLEGRSREKENARQNRRPRRNFFNQW